MGSFSILKVITLSLLIEYCTCACTYATEPSKKCTTGVANAAATAALCKAACDLDPTCLGAYYVTAGETGCSLCTDVTSEVSATHTIVTKGVCEACGYSMTEGSGCTTSAADGGCTSKLACLKTCNAAQSCLGIQIAEAEDDTSADVLTLCTDVTAIVNTLHTMHVKEGCSGNLLEGSCTYTSTAAKKCVTGTANVAADAEACKDACDSDSTCKAAYYLTADGSGCTLCTDATSEESETHTIVVQDLCDECTYYSLEQTATDSGLKVAYTAAGTLDACKDACDEVEICKAFDFKDGAEEPCYTSTTSGTVAETTIGYTHYEKLLCSDSAAFQMSFGVMMMAFLTSFLV